MSVTTLSSALCPEDSDRNLSAMWLSCVHCISLRRNPLYSLMPGNLNFASITLLKLSWQGHPTTSRLLKSMDLCRLSFFFTYPLNLMLLINPFLKHCVLIPYMTAYCPDSLCTSLDICSLALSPNQHINGHWTQAQRTWFLFLTLFSLNKWLPLSEPQFMISIIAFSSKF